MPPEDDNEVVEAEIMEPQFQQVQLSPDEADLMGLATMNLINTSLELDGVMLCDDEGEWSIPNEQEAIAKIQAVWSWAFQLNNLIAIQTAKAGLAFLP
jgi:hypothetical protein